MIDENSVAGENEMVILGISVNPISTRGMGAVPHYYSPLRFSDLPPSLKIDAITLYCGIKLGLTF